MSLCLPDLPRSVAQVRHIKSIGILHELLQQSLLTAWLPIWTTETKSIDASHELLQQSLSYCMALHMDDSWDEECLKLHSSLLHQGQGRLQARQTEVCPRRVCMEEFREINGRLLNAKRHSRDELERMFPHWDFSLIPQEDETWSTEEYEADLAVERGAIVVCYG